MFKSKKSYQFISMFLILCGVVAISAFANTILAADEQNLEISDIVVELDTTVGSGKASVIWNTNQDVACAMNYSEETDLTDYANTIDYYTENNEPIANGKFRYVIEIENLKLSTTYYYKIACGNDGASLLESGVKSFVTESSDESTLLCLDSDGGKNYNEKGSLRTRLTQNDQFVNSGKDFCEDTIYLVEEYCPESDTLPSGMIGYPASVKYACPNGCNNGACIPVGQEKPDLVIDDVYIKDSFIQVKYCNTSSASSLWSYDPMRVKIKANGIERGERSSSLIPPQTCTTLLTGYPLTYFNLTGGEEVGVIAEVDWENVIAESNEDNNTFTKTINVGNEVDDDPFSSFVNTGIEIEAIAEKLVNNKFDEILTEIKEIRDIVKERASEIKYLEELKQGAQALSATTEGIINDFITYGVDGNTKNLGAGERAAVIHSYKAAFSRLPETKDELTDAIKIASGRWPSLTSDAAEKAAKEQFKKIYKKIADMDNPNDNAAIVVMAYGLRQRAENRNLDSERAGINIFKSIYGYVPSTTEEWNIMQSITYSGASRGIDTDGDLLLDEREAELGTDPNNPDSDGDGYTDGEEVANGYDPLRAQNDWQTYDNEKLGYTIEYPKNWVYEGFGGERTFFGTPESKQGGYIWAVYVFEPNELEKEISDSGSQFDDRVEHREEIKINENINGIIVTVTTLQIEDWIYKRVYFEKNDKLFAIGNGAIDDDRFEKFYKSFEFNNNQLLSIELNSFSCQQGDSFAKFDVFKNETKITSVSVSSCESQKGEFITGNYFSILPGGLGGYILYGKYSNLYRVDLNTNSVEKIFDGTLTDIDFFLLNKVVYKQDNNIIIKNLDDLSETKFDLPTQDDNAQFGSFSFSPDVKKVGMAVGYGPDNERGEIHVLEIDYDRYYMEAQIESPLAQITGWDVNGNVVWE